MTVPWALALIGFALVLWPAGVATYRRFAPGTSTSSVTRLRALVRGMEGWSIQRCRAVVGSVGAVSGVVLLPTGIPVAIAGSAIATTFTHAVFRIVRERSVRDSQDRDIDALAALSAELRAGQTMSAGLRAAASAASTDLRAGFHGAASAVELGADPIATLLQPESPELLISIGRMWQLSLDAGCPLAEAVEAIELDYRGRRAHRQQLKSLLAGPSATAGMLALLPVFGLFMGSAIGARPVHILTETSIGGVVLVTGTLLTLTGIGWTRIIVRRAREIA